MTAEQCQSTGKRKYPTYKAAATVMNGLRRKRHIKRSSRPVRCYKCPDCGHWHLTSMNEAEQHERKQQ